MGLALVLYSWPRIADTEQEALKQGEFWLNHTQLGT